MKVKVYPKVGKDVERVFRSTVKGFHKVSPLPKEVQVLLVPGASVSIVDGAGFGVFVLRDNYVAIAIAGQYCNEMKGTLSRKEWLETIPESIAHEWAHMEQWREGRPLNHSGIANRTKQLLKAIIQD